MGYENEGSNKAKESLPLLFEAAINEALRNDTPPLKNDSESAQYERRMILSLYFTEIIKIVENQFEEIRTLTQLNINEAQKLKEAILKSYSDVPDQEKIKSFAEAKEIEMISFAHQRQAERISFYKQKCIDGLMMRGVTKSTASKIADAIARSTITAVT